MAWIDDIVDEYYSEIYYYCARKVKNTNDAYDITQEVFYALISNHDNINSDSIRGWLYSTAKKQVAYYIRNNIRQRKNESPLSDNESVTILSPLEDLSDEEIYDIKDKILSELSEEELQLYKDCYVKKMSYDKLSHKYGTTKDAMYKRISRLKALIKQKKDKYI